MFWGKNFILQSEEPYREKNARCQIGVTSFHEIFS